MGQSVRATSTQNAEAVEAQLNTNTEADMSDINGISHDVPAMVSTLRNRAAHAAEVQSEIGKKLGEMNQHWLARIQSDSTEAWQTLFKVGGTAAVGEKIKLCELWIEGAMKKAAEDAAYALECAQALGRMEMGLFSIAPPKAAEPPKTDSAPDNA